MAHALHQYIKENCNDKPFNLCTDLQPSPPGKELLGFIRNVSFVGPQKTQVIHIFLMWIIDSKICNFNQLKKKKIVRKQVRFNKDGDAYGYYNIYQYQKQENKYDYVQIGYWKETWVHSFNIIKIIWYLILFFSIYLKCDEQVKIKKNTSH